MSGVLFINPSAGGGVDGAELRGRFAGHRIAECDDHGFVDQVCSAVNEGADFVAVAGGDGTIRTAATVLRGGDVPLLPVPAGTKNHFARDVGIDSFEAAAAAIGGHTRYVDVGDVNGSCFVNNSSIGQYPPFVRRREAHERRLPKSAANLVAMYEQLRHGHRFSVDLDGEQYRVWMAFVGNGRYGTSLSDLSRREALDDGVLDVRIVSASRRFARCRIAGALLTGRLARSPLVHTVEARTVTFGVDRETIDVALDGEVQRMTPPLVYESRPRALPVRVPGQARAPF